MLIESIALSSIICVADFKLEDVLQDNAIVVNSVHDMNESVNDLKALGIFGPLVETFLDTSAFQYFSNVLISPEVPSTYGAFGIYPVVNYETGSVDIGALGVFELGNSDWANIVEASIEKMVQDPELECEKINLAGRTVTMFSFENEFVDEAVGLAESYGVQFDGLDRGYVGVSDGYFVICTEPDGIASVFNHIDGDVRDDAIASNPTFISSVKSLDSKSNYQTIVLLENLTDTLLQMDNSNTAMMMLPVLKSMFGDIDSIAASSDWLPSDDEVYRIKYRLQMNDGRGGLLGLISNSGIEQSELPTFVEDDSLYCFSLGFDWSRLPTLFQEIAMDNRMLAMQMGDELEKHINNIEIFVEPLDDKLFFVSAGMLPPDNKSATGDQKDDELLDNSWNHDAGITRLLAVPCSNERQCVNVLNMMLLDAEAEPREFLGHKIFTLDLFGGMMMAPMESSMSCAVAGGYLLVGTSAHIEHAIDRISDSNAKYVPASAAVGMSRINLAGASGWGYGDAARINEVKTKWAEKAMEDVLADLEAFDPEMAAEFRKDFESEQSLLGGTASSIMETFDGPMAWSLNVDEQGLFFETVSLKAQ